jgi:bifunctional non-homologous end joining protein LigD
MRVIDSCIASREALDAVVSPKLIKKPKATRVRPKLYTEIEYRDTSEGLLRASSFKGLTRK